MGMIKKLILTCDGPGCDLHNERVEGDPTYEGIQNVKVTFAETVMWDGWLCAPCEQRIAKAVRDTLPRASVEQNAGPK